MPLLDLSASHDVQENRLLPVKSGKTSLLLTRIKGEVKAYANKCPHLGLPLAKGKVDGSTLTCPWHGAQFDLCSGANVQWCSGVGGATLPSWTHGLIALGKEPKDLTAFEAREENGRVFVRVPG